MGGFFAEVLDGWVYGDFFVVCSLGGCMMTFCGVFFGWVYGDFFVVCSLGGCMMTFCGVFFAEVFFLWYEK